MTLLHSFPAGTAVELSQLGRNVWRLRYPRRTPYPSGIVVGRGRTPGTIRVQVRGRADPETHKARYWQPILTT